MSLSPSSAIGSSFPALDPTEMGSAITTEQKILAIMVKCTSIPSLLGSSYIAFEVLRDKGKRSKTYHRLLLAMSISDIFSSSAIFVGSWAIPKGTDGIYMAFGTETTCKIQGFFNQFGVVTPLYNGMLALYYLLSINWGWKEYQINSIEKYMHAAPILWGLTTAISLAAADLYGQATLWCWLGNGFPLSNILRYALYYGPVIVMLLLTTTIMIIIYRYVRAQEDLTDKYDFQRKMELEVKPSSDLLSISISGTIVSAFGTVVGTNLRKSTNVGINFGNGFRTSISGGGDVKNEIHFDGNRSIDVGSSDVESGSDESDSDVEDSENDDFGSFYDSNSTNRTPISTEQKQDYSGVEKPITNGALEKNDQKNDNGNENVDTSIIEGGGEIVETISKPGQSRDSSRRSRGRSPSNRSSRSLSPFQSREFSATMSEKKHHVSRSLSPAPVSYSRPYSRAIDSDDNDCASSNASFGGNDLGFWGSRALRRKRNAALKKNRHSKRVMYQSLWYIIAFYLSFIFACSARIVGSLTGSTPFPLLLLFSIFFPMQGFFNFLVYMRPRFFNQNRARTNSNNRTVQNRRRSASSLGTRYQTNFRQGVNSAIHSNSSAINSTTSTASQPLSHTKQG